MRGRRLYLGLIRSRPGNPCGVDEQVHKFKSLARLSGVSKDLDAAIGMIRTLESRKVYELMQELREACLRPHVADSTSSASGRSQTRRHSP